jgi:hypothetical protein
MVGFLKQYTIVTIRLTTRVKAAAKQHPNRKVRRLKLVTRAYRRGTTLSFSVKLAILAENDVRAKMQKYESSCDHIHSRCAVKPPVAWDSYSIFEVAADLARGVRQNAVHEGRGPQPYRLNTAARLEVFCRLSGSSLDGLLVAEELFGRVLILEKLKMVRIQVMKSSNYQNMRIERTMPPTLNVYDLMLANFKK